MQNDEVLRRGLRVGANALGELAEADQRSVRKAPRRNEPRVEVSAEDELDRPALLSVLSDFTKWSDHKLNFPFLDADINLADITSKGEPVDLEGWKLIRPNAYSKRPVVRNSAGEVLDLDDIQTEAYSGRWGRLMLQPKAYNRDDNKGVKFYVDAVQLLGNDDSISKGGGSKGEAFSAVDDEDEDEDALD